MSHFRHESQASSNTKDTLLSYSSSRSSSPDLLASPELETINKRATCSSNGSTSTSIPDRNVALEKDTTARSNSIHNQKRFSESSSCSSRDHYLTHAEKRNLLSISSRREDAVTTGSNDTRSIKVPLSLIDREVRLSESDEENDFRSRVWKARKQRKMMTECNNQKVISKHVESKFDACDCTSKICNELESDFLAIHPTNIDNEPFSSEIQEAETDAFKDTVQISPPTPYVSQQSKSKETEKHSNTSIMPHGDTSSQPNAAVKKSAYSTDSTKKELLANASLTSTPSSILDIEPPPSNNAINLVPIIATEIDTPPGIQWSVHEQCLLVRSILNTHSDTAPRNKVAGFDLDQTLVQWRCSGWPTRLEHYELWSPSVIAQLQGRHDEGYKLVIFSNQGGIRGAFQGKIATRVKNVIDWIALLIDRPLFAVCSTKKDSGYHKGSFKMWKVMEEICNDGIQVSPELSFYVGDADGVGGNNLSSMQQQYQLEGVDKTFAENVGKLYHVKMRFFTPEEFFGVSTMTRNTKITVVIPPSLPVSKETIATRAALLGGYLSSPILLVLVGVQGSGKSCFSKSLVGGNAGWSHYNQDTICGGRPGKREAVEAAVLSALQKGQSVVVDRMNLDPEQRNPYIKLGKECNVSVHSLVMIASVEDACERVKQRVNHPGKVEGETGARMALSSFSKLVLPLYEEGFALISYAHGMDDEVLNVYRRFLPKNGHDGIDNISRVQKTVQLHNAGGKTFPMVTIGTMGMPKQSTSRIITQAIHQGIESIDTAPTYNNEGEVGMTLEKRNFHHVKLIIKVPKRAISPSEARHEVKKSLSLLRRKYADVILLHWPSDLIEQDTLQAVWKELETMQREGLCHSLGVSNFSINALNQLLQSCSIRPSINQIERHPLLPQYDLMEFCHSQGIVVQAHTPLGHGSSLLMEHKIIRQISKESGMSPAQVLLLWNIQQGVPLVTKFTSEGHMQEMLPLLNRQGNVRLEPREMKIIDDLSLSSESVTRFVAPSFMFRRGAVYSWGDGRPSVDDVSTHKPKSALSL